MTIHANTQEAVMVKKSESFDRVAAGNRIAAELQKLGGKEIGCAGLKGVSGLADVPKGLVREVAEAHPNVHVRKVKSDKYEYSYKETG
jgi:hypothetical protein